MVNNSQKKIESTPVISYRLTSLLGNYMARFMRFKLLILFIFLYGSANATRDNVKVVNSNGSAVTLWDAKVSHLQLKDLFSLSDCIPVESAKPQTPEFECIDALQSQLKAPFVADSLIVAKRQSPSPYLRQKKPLAKMSWHLVEIEILVTQEAYHQAATVGLYLSIYKDLGVIPMRQVANAPRAWLSDGKVGRIVRLYSVFPEVLTENGNVGNLLAFKPFIEFHHSEHKIIDRIWDDYPSGGYTNYYLMSGFEPSLNDVLRIDRSNQ
jgi:hypothetical protein